MLVCQHKRGTENGKRYNEDIQPSDTQRPRRPSALRSGQTKKKEKIEMEKPTWVLAGRIESLFTCFRVYKRCGGTACGSSREDRQAVVFPFRC